ncbi:uncharacterized protein LOC126601357 [Malus sylvestris]|uniref:uncharacterized protein LOC126601357 n=1 Tax=Malus sylvestris TaxID=3752 RepID=UPI0021ACBEE2|nr:uncharacterized protein LOC126601357 [Malus sylvestris]XP_050124017.1 uncharacterized protein LOC126601357 [Malus sylvestris]
MEKELPIDKISNRRVSIFTPGWEIYVEVKTIDLSQLILKEWKKKKHEQWRMKKAVEELKPSTTPRIIRIWNKVQQIRKKINSDQTTFLNTFHKHHTRLKVQRLKYKIKYSKSNWSKSIAIRKLSKLKINHENLKHQVQANGWQAWL